jgi:hypothetical protein
MVWDLRLNKTVLQSLLHKTKLTFIYYGILYALQQNCNHLGKPKDTQYVNYSCFIEQSNTHFINIVPENMWCIFCVDVK